MLCPSMQHSASLQLIAGLDQLAAIRDFVQQEATRLGVDQSAIDDLLLAVTEVVTNSIEHGYDEQPGPITIEIGVNGDSVLVSVSDQAPPFDPRWVLCRTSVCRPSYGRRAVWASTLFAVSPMSCATTRFRKAGTKQASLSDVFQPPRPKLLPR